MAATKATKPHPIHPSLSMLCPTLHSPLYHPPASFYDWPRQLYSSKCKRTRSTSPGRTGPFDFQLPERELRVKRIASTKVGLSGGNPDDRIQFKNRDACSFQFSFFSSRKQGTTCKMRGKLPRKVLGGLHLELLIPRKR